MSTSLSTERLDDVAARVIAGVTEQADEEILTPFFASIMEQVESRPLKFRKYTAAQFFLRQPDKFKQVVHYLARGVGVRRIAEELVGCSVHTVQAVRDQFPKSVATEKERLADLCMTAATMQVERIIEDPDVVPGSHAGLVAAQLIDKAGQLRGGPTVTIEHRHTFSHDDFNKLVEAIPVESEVTPIGYEAGKVAQTGPAAPSSPGAGADAACLQSAGEKQSLVPLKDSPSATPDATPRPGGEGVDPNEPGGANEEPF